MDKKQISLPATSPTPPIRKSAQRSRPFWKRGDFILLSGVTLLALLLLGGFYLFGGKGDLAVITVDGKVYGRYDLAKDRQVEITDASGQVTNRLRIQNETVWMEWADCPDQICVEHAAVSRGGQTIICLPNRVAVEIKRQGADALDGVAG